MMSKSNTTSLNNNQGVLNSQKLWDNFKLEIGRLGKVWTCSCSTELNFCRRKAFISIWPGGFPTPARSIKFTGQSRNQIYYRFIEEDKKSDTKHPSKTQSPTHNRGNSQQPSKWPTTLFTLRRDRTNDQEQLLLFSWIKVHWMSKEWSTEVLS